MKNNLRTQAVIGFVLLIVLGIGPGMLVNYLLFLAGAQKGLSLLAELVVTALVYYGFESIRVIKNMLYYKPVHDINHEEQILKILRFHWYRGFWFCMDSPLIAAWIGLEAAVLMVVLG